jgi:hypothetical protein
MMNLMKPALQVLALLLLCHVVSGQSITPATIPAPVMDQFTLLYPDAENIIWKAQQGRYLAQFKNNKMITMALIHEDGKLLQTETEIKVIALPPEATVYLQDESGVKKIESASILESETGVITFKAVADRTEYWFDNNGQLFNPGMAVNHSRSNR